MIFKTIKKGFEFIFRHPYYYIPPCPECGSRMTGRYIRPHRDVTAEWEINESLRHGELVKPSMYAKMGTAFCLDCENEWPEDIKLSFITTTTLNEEKKTRLTREILQERLTIQKEEEPKGGGIFNIKKFIGKI